MKYLFEATAIAGCVGAYRVYTDRRRSVVHSNWDAYRHLWLASTRRVGDFLSSVVCDAISMYPQEARSAYSQLHDPLRVPLDSLERWRGRLLFRAGRYRIWEECKNLSYLQRLGHAEFSTSGRSIFSSPQTWQQDVTFSSPTCLHYVKDESSRKYLNSLSLVRDGFMGVLEGSPSEILAFVENLKDRRRDVLQDVRKGHVLDRHPPSSISLLHELRMHIEYFLFSQTGPDPDRSSYIEKCLQVEESGQLERLFPYLECIVDDGVGFFNDKGLIEKVKKMAPNTPIIVPCLRLDGTPIARLTSSPAVYSIDPLMHSELRFNGVPPLVELPTVGESYTLSRNGGETLKVKVTDVSEEGAVKVCVE
jgi:hypothetical protein